MEAPPGTNHGDVTADELRLAARNHGLPLEVLRYDLTPIGLHYLLDPLRHPGGRSGRLAAADRRRRRAAADALARRPARPRRRCTRAGHAGVRRQRPGAAGAAAAQPAVARRGDRHRRVDAASPLGAAARGGRAARRRRRDALHRPGPRHRGRRRAGLPAQPPARRGARARRAARLRDERRAAPAAARLPAAPGDRPAGTAWRTSNGCARSRRSTEPFDGYQQTVGYRMYDADGVAGAPVTRIMPRSLTVPPGIPDFLDARAHGRSRPLRPARAARGPGWAPITRVEVSVDDGATWARGRARRAARRPRVARLELRLGGRAGRARGQLARDRRRGQRPAARRAVEPQGLREQRRRADSRDRPDHVGSQATVATTDSTPKAPARQSGPGCRRALRRAQPRPSAS